MVKRRPVPVVGRVTAIALLAEAALMRIVLGMASVTAGRRIAVCIAVSVTVCAAGAQV